jgi:hypothetical protein
VRKRKRNAVMKKRMQISSKFSPHLLQQLSAALLTPTAPNNPQIDQLEAEVAKLKSKVEKWKKKKIPSQETLADQQALPKERKKKKSKDVVNMQIWSSSSERR